MTDAPETPQVPENEPQAPSEPPEPQVLPSPEPETVNVDPDDEIGADRVRRGKPVGDQGRGRGRGPRPGRVDLDIPPGARTIRNLQDRNRVIE